MGERGLPDFMYKSYYVISGRLRGYRRAYFHGVLCAGRFASFYRLPGQQDTDGGVHIPLKTGP